MTDTGTGRQAAGTPVQATGKAIGAGLLSTLALLMGLASFGIDLYLPAFPVMTTELSTTATGVQLSLTAFLIGAGAGQLVFGPWSDRAGRAGARRSSRSPRRAPTARAPAPRLRPSGG